MRIAVVAPSSRFSKEAAERVTAIAAISHPDVALHFHPQCFLAHNHFAGTDDDRGHALVEVANDPGFDAVWFARGGYGACRIAEAAIERFGPAARDKAYLGYSDAGLLLAGCGLLLAGFLAVNWPMTSVLWQRFWSPTADSTRMLRVDTVCAWRRVALALETPNFATRRQEVVFATTRPRLAGRQSLFLPRAPGL